MTRCAWLAATGLGAALACAEWAGPALGGPRLAVVPVFGAGAGTVLLNDLDRLRVIVTAPASRAGGVVADTTVAVDSAGDVTLTVPVLVGGAAAELFYVQLEGIRSGDGTVLYSGFDTITVQAGHATRVDSVPVSYIGRCQLACVVGTAPQNLTLKPGGSFGMTVNVDSVGAPVPNVPVRLTNLTPGMIGLARDLTVTALSGTSCGPARVAAAIPGATDTLRLSVSAPVTIPAVLFAGDSAAGLSSGVFCHNTNGTGRFLISRNGAFGDVSPRYSPDRQLVAYTFNPTGIQQQLWVARWAGDTEAVVDTISPYHPRWSPDGLHLAYECGIGLPTGVCVILDASVPILGLANAPRIFVTDSVLTRTGGPSAFAWDPRSPGRIAFARDILIGQWPSSAIYVANYDGTGITQLTLKPIDFGAGVLQLRELDWSPRGDVIVFSALDTVPGSPIKLYAINRDGTGVRRLTTGPDYDSRPIISPDGSQVLFLRNSGGCSIDYWRIRIDGTGEQQVTSETFCDVSTTNLGHDWSPDGTQIVVVGSGPNGQYNGFMVYRLPAGTTAAKYVVNRVPVRGLDAGAFSNDGQPSWRP